MEPRFFLAGDGRNAHIPHPGSPRLGDWGATSISHSNAPHYPISPHIDEDALEGVYFAFSTILRCLPYFLRKTRPRVSYELLEAFSSSLTADRASVGFPTSPILHFPMLQHPTLQHPISPHIDEDALEGLYFAFSTILRCLPYFFRKTRPTTSYELLEAFLPSCG